MKTKEKEKSIVDILLDSETPLLFNEYLLINLSLRMVTVSQRQGDSDIILFHTVSMLGDFCRHLVGKNSDKCLSLRQRLNALCWQVGDHMDIFLN